MTPLALLRFFCAALGLALAGLIVWAFGAANFFQSFAAIAGDPWGLVSLTDLYLGFLLMAVVIWRVEGPGWRAGVIAASLFVLGNVAAALWFAWRAPRLLAMTAPKGV